MNIDNLLYEIDSLRKFEDKCYEKYEDEHYSKYYSNLYHKTSELMSYFCIFNYPSSIKTHADYMAFLKNINPNDITKEQKEQIKLGRSSPYFKYIMGQISMENKSELEYLIGKPITYKGIIVIDENEKQRQAVKTIEQLRTERQEYDNILTSLYSAGIINIEQYKKYSRDLFNIYNYFDSISKGEQIGINKWTNADYAVMEQKAKKAGFIVPNEFNEYMKEYNENARKEFEYTQFLQDVFLESQTSDIKKSK